MSPPFSVTCDLESETATAALAERLAPRLQPGDTILLAGPIGAGKTHFARALIKKRLAAADRDEDVPSPTFTLVQTYDDGETEIWHADLYRVSGPDEILELGLDDAFRSAIVLVEWPDRLGREAPRDALRIDIAHGTDETTRRLRLTSEDPRWSGILRSVLPEGVGDG